MSEQKPHLTSFRRKLESSAIKGFWMPVSTGMTEKAGFSFRHCYETGHVKP